ncbi:sulfatase [Halosimplex litoreum]|uniref:Sulfatase n=1 Tax=Halosimplex litoreum TaxID=1198301 RepID=A0A7T3G0K4_9EURY|nr:sulfatase [Halosimplex litoreum]QPV64096.1 sulfatase [Halosimplex litoreum]
MRILYVDCDSLRPDHLGCYGYHRDTSPTIDRIAAEGRRFTNYYVSDAPCLPSRTAFFTGRFGRHTGVVNHSGVNADVRHRGSARGTSTDGRYRTLPRELLNRGHTTALVSPFPQRHGAFHVLDGFETWHDTGGGGAERAEVVAPYAESWLDDHATDEDWYLHVNFWDPHTPYDTPQEYGNPFEDDPAPAWLTDERIAEQYESYGPHSARDLHHGYLYGRGPQKLERTPDEIADREDFRRWVDGYDVGVRYMDDYIGGLVDRLKAAGVYEETLVVISADHGENLGERNVYGDHQTADDKTCRVPLIVSGPDVEPGVDDDLHYHLDFAATLVDLVGGEVPAGWDGESFLRALVDGESDGREYLVTSQGAWACQRGVRFDDWLLVRTYHDGWKAFDPVELYDLDVDPHETENLARDRPEVAERGMALLEQWLAQRGIDAATGRNGGNPDAPRALADPLLEEMREGGPTYLRDATDSYAERLRETGREGHADEIERRDGVVEQSPAEYLR